MVRQGSRLFVSRSNCEPTQSAWESLSGRSPVDRPVDPHLFTQVLRPSGTGSLEPYFQAPPAPAASGGKA